MSDKISFSEKDPQEVESLPDLQIQARFNTRNVLSLSQKVRELEEKIRLADREIIAAKSQKQADDLVSQKEIRLGELKKTLQDTRRELDNRRKRSSTLLRRKSSLETKYKQEGEQKVEQEAKVLDEGLGVSALVGKRSQIEASLVSFADSLERIRPTLRSNNRRGVSKTVLALERACRTAYELLTRIPPIDLLSVDEN
jgi:predicted  nucleic acid-binding Zn-ribbon protein